MFAAVVAAVAALTVMTSTRDVRSLAITPGGDVVAATTGGVLLVIVKEGREQILTTGAGRAVLADAEGIVAATAAGVFGFDGDGSPRGRIGDASVHALSRWRGQLVAGAPSAFAHLPAARAPVVALAAVGPDSLLIGTLGKGLTRWPSGERVAGVDALVWSVAATPDGGAFVATAAGLVHLDRRLRLTAVAATRAAAKLARADIRAVAVSGDRLVIGTWGGGAYLWNGTAFRQVGPADTRVQAVALRGDRVAIGTPEGGFIVDRLVDAPGAVTAFAGHGLVANDLSAVAPAPDGGAWIGTFDRGLQRVDARGQVVGAWTERDGLLDDCTNALAPGFLDGTPGVFIATERGLAFRGDAGGLTALPPFDRHLATVAVVAGRVYAGASDGLYVLGRDHLERIESFPLRRVTAIASIPATDGRPRFVGSAAGLVVHGDDGHDAIVDATSGLPEDWVTALAPAGEAVFAGTYRHGVVRVDAAGHVTAVSIDRWVSPGALVADAAGILTGTLGDGLFIGPAVGDAGAWAQLAGLPDRQVTGLARARGVLWIATRGGLARLALE